MTIHQKSQQKIEKNNHKPENTTTLTSTGKGRSSKQRTSKDPVAFNCRLISNDSLGANSGFPPAKTDSVPIKNLYCWGCIQSITIFSKYKFYLVKFNTLS